MVAPSAPRYRVPLEAGRGQEVQEEAPPDGLDRCSAPRSSPPRAGAVPTSRAKLGRKQYEAELAELQAELVAMQEWVKATGAKVCIVFEGRDTAGKGGTIKRIVERVSPRVFRVVALPAPTEREKSQMYIQRYIAHFPAAGEVVIFDRSWYNRAGVERGDGILHRGADASASSSRSPPSRRRWSTSGIILLKYWLEVGADEQTRGSRAASTTRARCGSCPTWT